MVERRGREGKRRALGELVRVVLGVEGTEPENCPMRLGRRRFFFANAPLDGRGVDSSAVSSTSASSTSLTY